MEKDPRPSVLGIAVLRLSLNAQKGLLPLPLFFPLKAKIQSDYRGTYNNFLLHGHLDYGCQHPLQQNMMRILRLNSFKE